MMRLQHGTRHWRLSELLDGLARVLRERGGQAA